jgi:glyoxylate reductase
LLGKTLGVVGLGRIGHALARRCHGGWGMPIVYHNRSENEWSEKAIKDWGARAVSFDELLGTSDFVSAHASLNAQSKGMFDAAAFAKMKRTAVFVNTARGGLCVQQDLVAALKSGTIFAAGLDVTDPEPPDPADELLKLPNVVIAPHIGSATFSARSRIAEIAARNLLAGLRGEPLPHEVKP